MLSLPASTRIFLCREAVDFRKAHDGRLAVVRDELGEDVFGGGIFVFLNKRRDRIKLLEWDGNDLWLHYKRLEKGTFRWVAAACGEAGTSIAIATSASPSATPRSSTTSPSSRACSSDALPRSAS